MDDYSTEVGRLQQKLRDRRAELADLDTGSSEHHEQAGEVLLAARAMADYEAQVPVLRDVARYQVSRRFVYTLAGVETAAVAWLGVLSAIGELSRWYLAPVLLALTFTISVLGTEPGAGRGGHGTRVASVVFALLTTALLALVMLRVISANWLFGGLGLLIVALVLRVAASDEQPVTAP